LESELYRKKKLTGFQQETRNKNFGYLTKNNKKYV